MDKDQFSQLQTLIKDTVEATTKVIVNGKIDRLQSKLDQYILDDNEWKKSAQPAIDLGNTARGASTAALWLAGVVITIGGAIAIITGFFKKQ